MNPADHPDPSAPPRSESLDPARAKRRAEVARAWAKTIGRTAYVPMSTTEMEQFLLDLVHQVADALHARPFTAKPAVEVGRKLVESDFTGQESLQVTVEVLGAALLVDSDQREDMDAAEKVVALLSGLATGFSSAMRLRTLDQQEHIKQALLKSKREAEQREREAQARFEEVFNSSAIGIALSDLDGTCVQTNPALGNILEYRADELTGRSIYELFSETDVVDVRTSYDELAAEVVPRIRQRRRMLRSDGTVALVYCVVSLLRDADGRPSHHATMITDLSELQALQNQLGHQSVHDLLTGLSNRQHFESKVDVMLESSTDESSMTLVHLGLDAFSVINNGLGHDVGDRVLQVVANKLTSVAAEYDAVVGRLGGDEFGILIDNTDETPDFQNLINDLNVELAEPVYIGDNGVAVSASIGVFQHVGRFQGNADPMRAANSTMRRAKANGKRQWELYDPCFDAAEKAGFALAAAMPGAWENGELGIEYEPVIRLADGSVTGAEVLMRWEHTEGEVIGDARCREMAERTGMSLTIGPWVFHRACEQIRTRLPRLDRDGRQAVLRLRLTALQSSDGDLAATVNTVIARSGLPASRIEVALDAGALLNGQSVALDNLSTLADIGVHTALHEFTGGYRQFAVVEEHDVRSVILAADVAENRQGGTEDALTRFTAGMVASLHDRDTLVSVAGVRTERDAAWWRTVGVDFAQGLFAGGPGQVDEVLDVAGAQEADGGPRADAIRLHESSVN